MTRDFRKSVKERAAHNSTFVSALRDEAALLDEHEASAMKSLIKAWTNAGMHRP
jgi:hypothetical protein